MIALIIILGVLAVIANTFMNEVDHRWSRFFIYLAPPGSRAEAYLNPRESWPRKKNGNKVVQWILSVPLVMFTDFWHLMKFIFLNCIFAIIILLGGWDWWIIIFMNAGWGFVFELFFAGIFGVLSDKLRLKNDGDSKRKSE